MIRFKKPYTWEVQVNGHLADVPYKAFQPNDTDDSLPKMLQSRLVQRGIAVWEAPRPERAVARPVAERRGRSARRAVDD